MIMKKVTKAQAIKSIQKRIDLLDNVKDYNDFVGWKSTSIGFLHRIFPPIHPIHNSIYKIDFNNYFKEDAIVVAKLFLMGLIEEINDLGLPDFNKEITDNNGVKFEVTNNNSLTQSTSVSISIDIVLEVFKGELRSSEIEELKGILTSQTDPKETKSKFIEKLKSFGENVSSNILANLVTNPTIWQNLSKLL